MKEGIQISDGDKVEKNLSNIEKLLEYQKQGYVFHGSSDRDLRRLEPQLNQDINAESDFDNDTAVFVSKVASISVIFACATENSVPKKIWDSRSWVWGVSYDELSPVTAKISTEWKPYLTKSHGYVYAFERGPFTLEEGWQVKSKKSVKPIDIIEVEFSDFEKLGGIVEWK
jgi:hypothetical protein